MGAKDYINNRPLTKELLKLYGWLVRVRDAHLIESLLEWGTIAKEAERCGTGLSGGGDEASTREG